MNNHKPWYECRGCGQYFDEDKLQGDRFGDMSPRATHAAIVIDPELCPFCTLNRPLPITIEPAQIPASS